MKRKSPFTLIEVMIALALLSLVLAPIAAQGYKGIQKWQYRHEIYQLKAQLQLAYDLVLHGQILLKVNLDQTAKGLICHLAFENKFLEKKFPIYRRYPHLKKMRLNGKDQTHIDFFCSFAGDLAEPLKISWPKASQEYSMIIKGYPHVLVVEK